MPLRLLIVDDDPALLDVYASFFRAGGAIVDAVSDPEQALARVAGNAYNVILSDLQMPGMNGIELLKRVRRSDLDVPVVLMTGGPTLATAVEAVEYGAFRYLLKPIAEATLTEVVHRAARYHALAQMKREALKLAGGSANWPGDRAALEGRFESALRQLWVALQPIVSHQTRSVHAYEALLRSDEETLSRPSDILEAAERLGRLHDLGRAVRHAVARIAGGIPPGIRLFVNLHPDDLNDPDLLSEESALIPFSRRIVLEVTERASLHGVSSLPGKIERLRALGYLLAIDDLGAGYAGLTSMAQLEPDYVKFDMSLIRDIQRHPTQEKLVSSMAAVCRDLGKLTIAEGIETAAERDCLAALGCDLMQGFLFARPLRTPEAPRWE